MISRFRPYYKIKDLLSVFNFNNSTVEKFETEFKSKFKMKHAISFSYGRTALYAILKIIKAKDSEVIVPSYTCSVVGNAVVLSGAIPKFVDSSKFDFNMIIKEIENKITIRTIAIIVTHLFGYPANVKKIQNLVKEKEKEYNIKIFVIQDCAHSFGASYNNSKTWQYGDFAFFGLNISKTINSIYGGMVLTNKNGLAKKLLRFKNQFTKKPSIKKEFKRRIFFITVFFSFQPLFYKIVNFLETHTSILDRITKEYHLDDKIAFPIDYQENLTSFEAQIGLIQLNYYDKIVQHKRNIALIYNELLSKKNNFILPPIVDGATYSHYVVVVKNREKILKMMRNRNIQLGELIQYSLPKLKVLKKYSLKKTMLTRIILVRQRSIYQLICILMKEKLN